MPAVPMSHDTRTECSCTKTLQDLPRDARERVGDPRTNPPPDALDRHAPTARSLHFSHIALRLPHPRSVDQIVARFSREAASPAQMTDEMTRMCRILTAS